MTLYLFSEIFKHFKQIFQYVSHCQTVRVFHSAALFPNGNQWRITQFKEAEDLVLFLTHARWCCVQRPLRHMRFFVICFDFKEFSEL